MKTLKDGHPMLKDWQNQYCENGSSTESNPDNLMQSPP
jgi:hypothetical protein